MTQILFLQLEYGQMLILGTESGPKVHFKPDLYHSKLSHEMELFPHFLPNFVFILVFTVFASTVSGFWPFSFKPPLENQRLRPKVLKAPLLYLGPRLVFSWGVI